MPATERLSGMPASIMASEEPHTVAIDEEPFELGDLRYDADGVGEALAIGEHRADGPPGKLAVADLAPARSGHAPDFADRIRREVVVQHEGLFVGALQRVDILLVLPGAERGDGERLGLAAGEQRAAMGAGQEADFADDRPDRDQVPPVDAPLGVEDARPDDVFFRLLEGARHFPGHRAVVVGGHQLGHHLLLDGGDLVAALMLGGDGIGLAQFVFAKSPHALDQLAVILGL